MEKADVFIADAHIMSMESECAEKLLSLLESIRGTTRTLYILGDLFDFWFGGNRVFIARYSPILDKLKELAEESVKIVFIEGNHEVNMGRFFTDTLKADVFTEEAKIDLNGKAAYLTHGDLIDRDDTTHIKWRKFLKGPVAYLIMKLLPGWFFIWLSKKISSTSRGYSKGKVSLKETILDKLVSEMGREGIETIIFAHTHTPLIKKNGDGFIVNPGAFMDNGSYARYLGGAFTLENFSLP